LSRKNGASRKHHKIKQLQQIITAVRHQGKTKTVNISRFTFITFFTVFWAMGSTQIVLRISTPKAFGVPALQNEGQNPRRILSHTPMSILINGRQSLQ